MSTDESRAVLGARTGSLHLRGGARDGHNVSEPIDEAPWREVDISRIQALAAARPTEVVLSGGARYAPSEFSEEKAGQRSCANRLNLLRNL